MKKPLSIFSLCFLFVALALGSLVFENLKKSQAHWAISKFPASRPKAKLQGLTNPPTFIGAMPAQLVDFEHQPKDIHDSSGYFFFYHTHRGGEHGHIHLFKKNNNSHHHLFAITFNKEKKPTDLFTTNAWVTDESATDQATILREIQEIRFNDQNEQEMKQYLVKLIELFQPQIQCLIEEKYQCLHKRQRPIKNDESIEILSQIPIDIATQNTVIFH